MSRVSDLATRLFGRLRRRPPTTRRGRIFRRVDRVVQLVILAYLGLQAYPQILFAHSVTAAGITLHARHPLPPDAAARLVEARRLVDASELAVPGRTERIFVCDSPWIFRLLAPLSSGSFAVSLPWTDRIYFAKADFGADLALAFHSNQSTRPLAGTMAHEITHGLIRRRLGIVRAIRLPMWVAEGYPEYVAGSGSFPADKGCRLIAAGQTDPSPSFRYFRAHQMVEHLVRDEHLTFDQIVARAHDEDAVFSATRASLQGRAMPR